MPSLPAGWLSSIACRTNVRSACCLSFGADHRFWYVPVALVTGSTFFRLSPLFLLCMALNAPRAGSS